MSSHSGRGAEKLFTTNFVLSCLANFVSFGGFYLLLATLPVYVKRIGGSDSQVGLIIGVLAATALVTRPFVGRASDRAGRKVLIVAGAVMLVASGVLYSFITSVTWLLALRVLHGAGFAAFGTALMALVADMSPAHRRGEAIGYFGASTNLAMVVGPALGVLVMQRLGFPTLFLSVAAAGIVTLGLSLALRNVSRGQAAGGQARTALVERSALFPSLVMCLTGITYASIVSFLPLFVEARNVGNAGLFFTVLGIVTMASRGPIGRISDNRGRASVVIPGLLLAAMGLVLLAYTSSMAVFVIVSLVYGVGFAAVQPALIALAVDRVGPEARGAAMGTFSAATDLGIGLGAIGWGLVSQTAGFSAMYVAAGGVALAGLALFVAGQRRGMAADLPRSTDAG